MENKVSHIGAKGILIALLLFAIIDGAVAFNLPTRNLITLSQITNNLSTKETLPQEDNSNDTETNLLTDFDSEEINDFWYTKVLFEFKVPILIKSNSLTYHYEESGKVKSHTNVTPPPPQY